MLILKLKKLLVYVSPSQNHLKDANHKLVLSQIMMSLIYQIKIYWNQRYRVVIQWWSQQLKVKCFGSNLLEKIKMMNKTKNQGTSILALMRPSNKGNFKHLCDSVKIKD